jgi:hypothetical protein
MHRDAADHPDLRPLIEELRRNASDRIRACDGDLNQVLEDILGQVFMLLYALTTEIDTLHKAIGGGSLVGKPEQLPGG